MKTLTFDITLEADDKAIPAEVSTDIKEVLMSHLNDIRNVEHIHRVGFVSGRPPVDPTEK